MSKKIYVLDTTLRDGEQVPGAKLNLEEKLEVAKQLVKLKVDMMEVGFPSSSNGDFEAVKAISKAVGQDMIVTALGRAVTSDIDAIYESLKEAANPMIHIVLGSSGVHLEKKFKKTPQQIMEMGINAVKYAKSLMPQVQYSLEDASRSSFDYMWETIEGVVRAGATIINIPDTVGFAVPEEFGKLIYKINDRLMNLNPNVILSVHCHNDTGLATANTLAAVRNGANKVECTINGIGERAGNTSLEEVVMGIKLHPEYYGGYTTIETKEIYSTSRLVSATMGLDVQVNKAITGENAFAHSSGIHQDGLLKSKEVYEIIEPQDIGAPPMELVLTARSGRHAFMHIVERFGYQVVEKKIPEIYEAFLSMADQKKEVYDYDVVRLMEGYPKSYFIKQKSVTMWEMTDFQVIANTLFPTATVQMKKGEEVKIESKNGEGAVDALYSAIIAATEMPIKLQEYRIHNIARGKESLGKVCIEISYDGKSYQGKAIEKDVIKASGVALVNAINKVMQDREE
ncbi:2-isopropylmalate synthase [Sporanaerobium hydrogeniformans]|uniref:2-isopropylmalate synthase n=1 Tax=Sporanaerobium hydrogeniformans TaxID=3072179 RepID=A0AC61D9R5_9FIRM|nr:2-isopropylmalate synthase [Sporanaerobium hydrogeniformans]PHV69302.1 2-isopropylmalate synthase [Sporanaerobium hydrogeniformans]